MVEILCENPFVCLKFPIESLLCISEKDEVVELLSEELTDLLCREYHKFWSQVIFDKSLHIFIDTYLRFAQRCYDIPGNSSKLTHSLTLTHSHSPLFLIEL